MFTVEEECLSLGRRRGFFVSYSYRLTAFSICGVPRWDAVLADVISTSGNKRSLL